MKVWLKQKHNELFDSFRFGWALSAKKEGRMVVFCPETDNVLLDCSNSFFTSQVEKGNIIICEEKQNEHEQILS